jgi:glycosyltransferase involved in cell wall biosynthesis
MTGFELPRTQRYEGWLARQFSRVLVTSETDRAALERLAFQEPFESMGQPGLQPRDHKSVAVLPNGADLEYFKSDDSMRREDILVFSGKMSYHANVAAVLYFARDVLPLIWQERPQVQLWIVGQAPPASVRALAADPRVMVTGFVPDMRPYISQATVAVCPLVYGAGIQNKVLEAMASGIPVVTGSVGASALKARAGEEMLVTDKSEEFARCVLQLLGNAEFAHRVGLAGRRFVEQHHDWKQIGIQLEAYYQESIETWNTHRPQTQK